MDPLSFALYVLLGLCVGIVAPMLGIGGGVMQVPILEFATGEMKVATAVSTFVILFTSSSGTLSYARQGRIDFKTGIRLIIMAASGGLVGGFFADRVEADQLKAIFGVTLLLVSIRGIFRAVTNRNKQNKETNENSDIPTDGQTSENENSEEKTRKDAKEHPNEDAKEHEEDTFLNYKVAIPPIDESPPIEYTANLKWAMPVTFIGGFLGGLLGLGGGVIYVPVLTMLVGLPIHIAAATSTFLILFSTLLAIGFRVEGGNIDWNIAIPMAIGAVVGGRIGANYAKKVKSSWLLTAFWTIAAITGIRYIILSISTL